MKNFKTIEQIDKYYSKLFGDLYKYKTVYPPEQLAIMSQNYMNEYLQKRELISAREEIDTAQQLFLLKLEKTEFTPQTVEVTTGRFRKKTVTVYNDIALALIEKHRANKQLEIDKIYNSCINQPKHKQPPTQQEPTATPPTVNTTALAEPNNQIKEYANIR